MHINPLVSVIIPTRNRCAILARALASIQAQTHTNWEALVVDDGSEDDTAQMIADLDDDRIRFFRNERAAGSGNGRWRGAQQSHGDYIAYLDSNDYWLENKLERQLACARECPDPDVLVLCPPMTRRGDALFKTLQPPLGSGEPVPSRVVADYIYAEANGTLQTSGLLLGDALGRRVCFDPELRVNQDTDYLLRLAAAGACFTYLDDYLYVQDIDDRRDRISTDHTLLQESLNWFNAVSGDWSPAARRGYYLGDVCIRCARQQRTALGLWYFLHGVDIRRSRYFMAQRFLRVLGGGEMPREIRRLGRRIGVSRGRRATL